MMKVGEQYYYGHNNKIDIWTCVYVTRSGAALLEHRDYENSADLVQPQDQFKWYPVPPRRYFKDLKGGQRFKWVTPRDCGDQVCRKVYLRGLTEREWRWIVDDFTKLGADSVYTSSNRTDPTEEVIPIP